MSAEATGWAWRHSPFTGVTLLAHLAIADSVNDQNDNQFWMSVASLAAKARASRRSAQAALKEMTEAGLLTVIEAGGGGPGDTTCYRFEMPSKGAILAPIKGAAFAPLGSEKGANGDELRVQSAPNKGATVAPKPNKSNPSTATQVEPFLSDAYGVDVERLCQLLADLVEANGSKRPTITTAWRSACDRLMRLDGRSADQIERAIRWCQADEFWRGNVLSMPKLREQYDRLRLAASRNGNQRAARPTNTDRAVSELTDWMAKKGVQA